MRSQFRPVAAMPTSDLSTPDILNQNTRIKAWMLALTGLFGMLFLGLTVMFFSFYHLMAELPDNSGNLKTIRASFLGVFLSLTVVYGGLTLGLLWQMWQWVQTLTRYVTTPAPSVQNARMFVREGKRLQVWVRVLQIGPFLLFMLGLLLAVAGQVTRQEMLETAGALLGFSTEQPGTSVGTALSLLLNFFILEAIRQWLRAVTAHALGSKNPVSPKLGPVGGWTLLWYLSLAFSILTSLIGTVFLFWFALDRVPAGIKLDMTAAQAGIFTRLSGGLQGTMLLAFLINVTLMVLLTLYRQFADKVSTALDERSYNARRAMQER